LLSSDAGEKELSSGLRFLAEAFATCGHIARVALRVRQTFARWRDDDYESDRRREGFRAHLVPNGGEASLKRFDMLLDGTVSGKTFVVGMNKTGTTTLKIALQEANVLCGPQQQHEALFPDWARRRFDRIVDLCRHYEAFQDVPFSLPFTYQALDQAFPDARFILSVRDSPEQWYESLLRFHRKVLFAGQAPSWELIDAQTYAYPGFVRDFSRAVFRWQDFGLYDKERAMDVYRRHNDSVLEYFDGRADQLLVLNLSEPDSYERFTQLLGLAPTPGGFGIHNAS
jgi:Sulfotransferase domain